MDSDDDFNSGMSSQDDEFEEELQESADDSMEEGMVLCEPLAGIDTDHSEPQSLRMTNPIWDFHRIKRS